MFASADILANPEVLALQQDIQDMDMQIEEQKIKIDSTPNPILRVSATDKIIDRLDLQPQCVGVGGVELKHRIVFSCIYLPAVLFSLFVTHHTMYLVLYACVQL